MTYGRLCDHFDDVGIGVGVLQGRLRIDSHFHRILVIWQNIWLATRVYLDAGTLTSVATGAVTGMGAVRGSEGGVAVAGVTVSLLKKLKDVGRATPEFGCWEDVSGDSGPGSGRETGRARGGIAENSGGRAVAKSP